MIFSLSFDTLLLTLADRDFEIPPTAPRRLDAVSVAWQICQFVIRMAAF